MKHKESRPNYLNYYSDLGGYIIYNFVSEGIQDKTRGYRFMNKYKFYDI